MTAPEQLTLDFPVRAALSAEDFLVAPPNAEAVRCLDAWPDWPGPFLVVHGEAGCGKTHLARVFMAQSGAEPLALADLASTPVINAVLEDLDGPFTATEEEALFHFYNRVLDGGGSVLVTAERPPAEWEIGLADLQSRLKAAQAVGVGAPDDALIAAVLVKQFADRQLTVEADVARYAVDRMERSFTAASRLVAAVDTLSLAEKRRITVPLVRRVLDELNLS